MNIDTLTQNWLKIRTIDTHTAGEPLRIIIDGFPELNGDTILAKRRDARENYDHLRRALMLEPRGHADMYGCLLTPPTTPDGDVGVLFMHNAGFSTMCGHGVIGLVQVGLDVGLFAKPGLTPEVRLDTPAGRVTAVARREQEHGRVQSVTFHNVPSFVYAQNRMVTVPDWGEVHYDVAFGGAFYAFVQAEAVGLALDPTNARPLIEAGRAIKEAVQASLSIHHPEEPDLGFLYGVIFTGAPQDAQNHSRNVCIFADGELDRSPTGTGVSARTALHWMRGELALGDVLTIESIMGTTFTTTAVREVTYATYDAIIPAVTGSAHLIGRNEWFIDPTDTLHHGFLLR